MGAAGSALTGMASIFRSLRYRNYRLFFAGQTISLIGTWMQMLAVGWLVYRMTNDPFLLGLLPFLAQLPTFVLMPLTGVWADRLDRRKTIIVTQSLMMLQAFALAILTIQDVITIPQLAVLGILSGIINAFDIPARQAFVVEMVEDKADLGNAIALNSSMVNGARLAGPAIAGPLVKAFGEGYCFLANAVSYVAVIAALLAMTPTPPRPRTPRKHPVREFKEGIAYAWRYLPIRAVLLLLATISLMGSAIMTLAPIFAKDILRGDVATLSYIMIASGLGALVGAAYLASRRTILGMAEVIGGATAVFGAGLIAFSFSRTLWISLVFMLFAGFGMMVQIAASNTVLQTVVDDDKRGRIMALWAMCFMGMGPFGSLLAGWLASMIGAPATVAISGVFCLAGAAIFLYQLPALRREIEAHYARQLQPPPPSPAFPIISPQSPAPVAIPTPPPTPQTEEPQP
jgi:MFS family permease